jgi:hypothetical protein
MAGMRIFPGAVRSGGNPEMLFAILSTERPMFRAISVVPTVTGVSGLKRAPDGGRVDPLDNRAADFSNTNPAPAGCGGLTAVDGPFSSSSTFLAGDLKSSLPRGRIAPATKLGHDDATMKPAAFGPGPVLSRKIAFPSMPLQVGFPSPKRGALASRVAPGAEPASKVSGMNPAGFG